MERTMQTSTLIVVSVATVLNVGLWCWSRPTDRSHQEAGTVQPPQRENWSPVQPSTTPLPTATAARPADRKETVARAASLPDQPWISTVRDGILQISQTRKFSGTLVISGLECQGSTCAITGSTKASSDGQWHGSSDVSALMKAMNDGQIAGGDTGRSVAVNLIQTSPDGTGVDYSLTVQDNNGSPFVNPCQSIVDAWKATHPDDFLENPDQPTIRNYNPDQKIPTNSGQPANSVPPPKPISR
jgi:hypothetical protein